MLLLYMPTQKSISEKWGHIRYENIGKTEQPMNSLSPMYKIRQILINLHFSKMYLKISVSNLSIGYNYICYGQEYIFSIFM
jgi:hypothetical protein